jgi:hypothetical protein
VHLTEFRELKHRYRVISPANIFTAALALAQHPYLVFAAFITWCVCSVMVAVSKAAVAVSKVIVTWLKRSTPKRIKEDPHESS